MIFIVSGERRVLYVTKGEDRTVRMVVRDKDTGEIVDLSGYVVTMTLRRKPSDGAALVSRIGVVVGPTADGTVDFDFVQADWLSLEPRRYVWDVWLTYPSGDRVQIVPLSDFVLQKSATAASDVPTSPTPSEIIGYGLPDPDVAAPGYVLTNLPAGTLVWAKVPMSFRLTFAAGVTGLPDKIALVNPALFGFRIIEVKVHCSTGVAGGEVTLQSGATVPGLVDVSEVFPCEVFSDGFMQELVPDFTRTVPVSNLLYLARSNDNVAGSILVTVELL